MIKYLLPKDGIYYKANLHMHTTISDGTMSPEETKDLYVKQGYSIVAFTDHEVMLPHIDLSDENFLAITSTEISMNFPKGPLFQYNKCYHLNIYSKDPFRNVYSTFNKKLMWLENSYDYISSEQLKIEYERFYSIQSVNEIIKKAKEEGCIVSLNHPVWSLQSYPDYIDLKGLWGIEWHNTGCIKDGYKDSFQPIDDLCRLGEKVFPIATDDAHKIADCFGGWVMIKAEKLQYDRVFSALEKGCFYSSTKPEIYELYIENGLININTSKCKTIELNTERRVSIVVTGENITNAKIDISSYLDECKRNINHHQYIRITVIDEDGFKAHTRAYFLEELM